MIQKLSYFKKTFKQTEKMGVERARKQGFGAGAVVYLARAGAVTSARPGSKGYTFFTVNKLSDI